MLGAESTQGKVASAQKRRYLVERGRGLYSIFANVNRMTGAEGSGGRLMLKMGKHKFLPRLRIGKAYTARKTRCVCAKNTPGIARL